MPRKNRNLRERARGFIDSTKERLNGAKESTEDFVSENPIKSVMIAAAVGTAIGIAISVGIRTLVRPRRRNFFEKIGDYF